VRRRRRPSLVRNHDLAAAGLATLQPFEDVMWIDDEVSLMKVTQGPSSQTDPSWMTARRRTSATTGLTAFEHLLIRRVEMVDLELHLTEGGPVWATVKVTAVSAYPV
jgi:hypothetical protein